MKRVRYSRANLGLLLSPRRLKRIFDSVFRPVEIDYNERETIDFPIN